jgi:hypothetical protein
MRGIQTTPRAGKAIWPCQGTPSWRGPWPANSASRLRKLTRCGLVRAESHPPAHAGTAKEFRDQHDCLYRIAALNRQIDALQRAENGATLGSHPQDVSLIALISEKSANARRSSTDSGDLVAGLARILA